MRLLDRYLLRELIVPLAYCVGGFLIFWIASDLFSELGNLQAHKLHAGDTAEYYLVKLPEFFVQVLPIALLLALLYTLTQHARHHEIVAIRAAGVSLWRLALPYFCVGLGASLVLFALNELWVPDTADRAAQIMNRRLQRQNEATERDIMPTPGLPNARDGRTWVAGEYNQKTGEMRAPWVIWTLSDGSQRVLKAERAIRTNGVWTFFGVREFRKAAGTNAQLRVYPPTEVLALPEFTETPEAIRIEIKISDRLSLRNARKADIPVFELLEYLHWHPDLPPAYHSLLYTKLYGRLAAPWTCLVVVLIALPFGAASGRRNVFVGVASSIFISFVYIVLLQLCLALGTGGWMTPWLAAWLPNLAFGITGVWLTARVK